MFYVIKFQFSYLSMTSTTLILFTITTSCFYDDECGIVDDGFVKSIYDVDFT